MKRLSLLLVLLIAALSLFSFSSCSKSGGKSGGVLVFGRSGDAAGLDPGRETDGESLYIADNVFENLVEFVPGTTEIAPCLAEKWDISANGLEFIFYLRKGVKFHDGTDFNADAVVFSLARQFKKDHPAYKYGPWKYWSAMGMDDIIKDVVKVDDYKVKIILKKKEAPFLANLAMQFAGIVSPAAVEKHKENFASNPVGTGPFKFVQWIKDDSIILERNDNYWREKAYLDRLILKVIPEPTARYLALKKGEVDIIDFPSPEDIENIKADKNLKVVEQPGLNVGYLAMNQSKKPFDNKLVRQAVSHAINKADIIKAVYGNLGTPAKNPIPPTMWSYNDSIKDYEYNPKLAKELLKKAGYENGFKTTLWAMPVSRPYNPNAKKVAEIMQAQLKEVGITADIVSYEWGTYLDKLDNLQHDMCLIGWTGDNGDPDNFLYVLLSIQSTNKPAQNYAFWKNEKFDSLIRQAKETFDRNKRTELYKEAQVIFHEEAPWVPIAHSIVVEPMKKNVMDFKLSPLGKREFRQVWIQK
ncbi:MAG TPA: ABC transporter substrate-binding protein [Spirochaetota bacterium]|nr:ABC transporter substrate-binding protein [Spirochaetota bacterium]